MKFSYNWLREFLPIDLPADDLSRRLLLLGFEVSDIQTLGPGFEGVVVGHILEVHKHPNADRLWLCRVTDGTSELSIVCGADNVSAGARVPVARVGARLPNGRSIERAKIRGVESQGMICSSAELGLAPSAHDGILVLPPETPVGADAASLLGETDAVLEVEITPNRPDCLSHLGLARELSIHFDVALKPLSLPAGIRSSAASAPAANAKPAPSRRIEIKDPDACSRYIAREFHGLRVGPSPVWLARRLESVGLRPINNLVDITNFVLFDLGHPLHAFDLDALRGDTVLVRPAKAGESLRALDGKTYALAPSDLVIADGTGPVAIAGVIGGQPTGATGKTTRALLESAHFEPASVRRTSRRLGIRTDSSYRFERGTDPEAASLASERAARLIETLCAPADGQAPLSADPTDVRPRRRARPCIEVEPERINRILGTSLPAQTVAGLLGRMAESVTVKGATLQFRPPSYRADLETPWDLAEEVARHIGYDQIPQEPSPVRLHAPKPNPTQTLMSSLREKLGAWGFSEAYSYDFISADHRDRLGTPELSPVEILNPLSEDQALLRPTLLVSLLQSASYNSNRGARNVRLFEIGKSYRVENGEAAESLGCAGILTGDFPRTPHWKRKPSPSDFFDVKGVVESLLEPYGSLRFVASQNGDAACFHPKAGLAIATERGRLIGAAGLLHPALLQRWDLREPAAAFCLDLDALAEPADRPRAFAAMSPFPPIVRDLSITVDDGVSYSEIAACLKDTESLASFDPVDVYTGSEIGAGKKSLTLRLTFLRQDRTLRDSEVQASLNGALARLEKACGAALRES
ncbi:MAG: phenylalanine--tRNA ligase subunit beta [Elusimicrobia bacterium]|nr:phenylalanine--tRNA ligase subunit beta [Elusimicrobiota bacterium]